MEALSGCGNLCVCCQIPSATSLLQEAHGSVAVFCCEFEKSHAIGTYPFPDDISGFIDTQRIFIGSCISAEAYKSEQNAGTQANRFGLLQTS